MVALPLKLQWNLSQLTKWAILQLF